MASRRALGDRNASIRPAKANIAIAAAMTGIASLPDCRRASSRLNPARVDQRKTEPHAGRRRERDRGQFERTMRRDGLTENMSLWHRRHVAEYGSQLHGVVKP